MGRSAVEPEWPPAILIGFSLFLGRVDFGYDTKKSRQGLRGGHACFSYQLSFVAEIARKQEKFTPKWPKPLPKGVKFALQIRGPNLPRNGPK